MRLCICGDITPPYKVEVNMISDPIFYTFMDSPLGTILLARNSRGLRYIDFQEGDNCLIPEAGWQLEQGGFDETRAQLQAYFNGELRHFTLPLAPEGTPFQLQVWETLQTVPYGETISYADLANKVGRPRAARAVGAANGKNPLPIVIPCHRVIGSNGQLTGYAGGIHLKEALLSLEQPGCVEVNQKQRLAAFQMQLL
jgi:methylated-DNA-[protein]-cysteine S-methyltransferase